MARVLSSKINERSLYDCFHARVRGNRIYCQKGHLFQNKGRQNGAIDIQCLARGEPLIMSICQECTDFEVIGEPLPCKERGWVKETAETAPQIQRGKVSLGDNGKRVVAAPLSTNKELLKEG